MPKDTTPPDGYPVGNTNPNERGRSVRGAGPVMGQPIPEDIRRKATRQPPRD